MTYDWKLSTAKTTPYIEASAAIDNKLESPNQKPPIVVLANLAFVLDSEAYHHTLLVFHIYFRVAKLNFFIKI